MTDLKSLAHPEWPYSGTPWAWRGFGFWVQGPVYADRVGGKLTFRDWGHWEKSDQANWQAVYQKHNFGPELT